MYVNVFHACLYQKLSLSLHQFQTISPCFIKHRALNPVNEPLQSPPTPQNLRSPGSSPLSQSMPLLRAKLICFYCNRRSSQAKTAGLRRWHCTQCDADNWLDEKGEVTDPPTTPSTPTTATRYVQPQLNPNTVSVSSSFDPITAPTEKPAETEGLFCATCLKNQHLYTRSLSNFYPDGAVSGEGASEREYEKAEAAFRVGLEERYPLICEECEPRVRERLRRVNYDAKADHLGRVMDRLRGGRRERISLGWRGWAVRVGGIAWAVSWVLQISWHIMGMMNLMDSGDGDGLVEEQEFGWKQCAYSAKAAGQISPACFDRVSTELVPTVLWVGLVAAWWHPRLQEKLDKPFAHVIGLADYYKLQVVSMGARWGCWYWVTHRSPVEPRTYHAVHLFMTLFNLLVILSSYRSVSIDYTPRVSFAESPEPLVRRKAASEAQTSSGIPISSTNNTQPSSYGRNPNTKPPTKFSISDLAPQPQPIKQPARLPTPPPEPYDDDAAMDWTPSITNSFSPAHPSRTTANNILNPPPPVQPSPFHGTLPSNVHPPSHRLRNPQTALPFFSLQPSSSKTGANTSALDMSGLGSSLFTSNPRPSTAKSHDPTSPSENDDDNRPDRKRSGLSFAPQRFFTASDRNADTGLEDLLATSFRLDETPLEVANTKASPSSTALTVRKKETRRQPSGEGAWIKWFVLGLVGMVGVAVVVTHGYGDDAGDGGGWVQRGFPSSEEFWRWFLDL